MLDFALASPPNLPQCNACLPIIEPCICSANGMPTHAVHMTAWVLAEPIAEADAADRRTFGVAQAAGTSAAR